MCPHNVTALLPSRNAPNKCYIRDSERHGHDWDIFWFYRNNELDSIGATRDLDHANAALRNRHCVGPKIVCSNVGISFDRSAYWIFYSCGIVPGISSDISKPHDMCMKVTSAHNDLAFLYWKPALICFAQAALLGASRVHPVSRIWSEDKAKGHAIKFGPKNTLDSSR